LNTLRRNLYALLIAAISFILVIGAIVTALAESGFTPPPASPATDTNIPISLPTTEQGLATPIPLTSTSTFSDTPTQFTTTEAVETPTVTPDAFAGSPTVPESTSSATVTESPVCTIPTGWIKYTIQSGDTLFSIAVRYQTNFRTLQAGNCMGSSTKIIAGSTLWVPNNPTITPTKTATASFTPLPTNTNLPTLTNTETPTPTNTPTETATPTPTFTPTISPTPQP
jgi:LysM repeat protein